MSRVGIVVDTITRSDMETGKKLTGQLGMLLSRTMEGYGVAGRECCIVYAITDLESPARRAEIWKAQTERVHKELLDAGVDKVLCCGGIASAIVLGLPRLPNMAHLRGYGTTAWLGAARDMPDPATTETVSMVVPTKEVYVVPTYSVQAVWRDLDLYRDLRADIKKFCTQDAPIETPPVQMFKASCVADVSRFFAAAEGARVLSCDIETTGFDPLGDTLLSLGFGALTQDGGVSLIIPRDLLYGPQQEALRATLLPLFRGETGFQGALPFHNTKFDIQFLRTYLGEWVTHPHLTDTLLMNYALDERPIGRYAIHGLKDISRVRFDAPNYAFEFHKFYKLPDAEKPWDQLYEYHALDCYYTALLWEQLDAELDARDETGDRRQHGLVQDLYIPAMKMLAEVQYYGVEIDIPYFQQLQSYLEEKQEGIVQKLQDYVRVRFPPPPRIEEEPVAPPTRRRKVQEDPAFNAGSPLQVQKLLYDEMGCVWEDRSTEKAALLSHARDVGQPTIDGYRTFLQKYLWVLSPQERATCLSHACLYVWIREQDRAFIRTLLQHRLTEKVLRTYVIGVLTKLGPDQKLHPDLLIAGTATGRLSSTKINIQNIPQHMGNSVRAGFTVEEGYTFCEADYSQLELRVCAWISEDPALLQTFIEGKDIHAEVASKSFRKPPEEITTYERYLAKCLEFGALYGRGVRSVIEGPEMEHLIELGAPPWTIEEAEVFLKDFRDGFAVLQEWMVHIKKTTLQRHYVEMPTGRRRRFPLILGHTKPEIERQAVNTPIQGLASDLTLTAAIRLHPQLQKYDSRILFLVHDSIAMKVNSAYVEEVKELVLYEMSNVQLPNPHGIPWKADVKVGERWGKLPTEGEFVFTVASAGYQSKARSKAREQMNKEESVGGVGRS